RESKGGGRAEQRSGKGAADQEVAWGERQFPGAGIDHRGNHVGRFQIIHFEAPAAAHLARGTTREKKTAITRGLTSDPNSFVAASIHRGFASGHHRLLAVRLTFKTCANILRCNNNNKIN